MAKAPKTVSVSATDIASVTSDAYCFDLYGLPNWQAHIQVMINLDWSFREIVAVLNSKHMRWHRDECANNPTAMKFVMYASEKLKPAERKALVEA